MIDYQIITDIERELITKYGFLYNYSFKLNTNYLDFNLYRVRMVNSIDEIKTIEHLSYPKNDINIGRCNFPNNPIFYCCDKSTTALAEVLKDYNKEKKFLSLSVWKFKKGININVAPLLMKAKRKGLIKDETCLDFINVSAKGLNTEKQLEEIENLFYNNDYFKSAAISKILLDNEVIPCDCIFYPSAVKK
jgi:hypothetical protein